MQKVLTEIYRLLPALFFFFFSFNLINFTTTLSGREDHLQGASLPLILIASALVAKILLVIDHLPIISLLRKKPLIYDILYKTALYSTLALLIRLIVRFRPYYPDFTAFSASMDWPRFWAIHIWYLILFFIFVSSRDLTRAIGPAKVQRLLFGPRK